MKHMLRKRFLLTAAAFVLALAFLNGCGSKEPKPKDFAGYYTLITDRGTGIAMQISKDGTVLYLNERSGSHRGTLEIKDGEAVIYLSKEYEPGSGGEKSSHYIQYCPLTFTLVDDGKSGLLSSEHENWNADFFDAVDKKTFETFIDEECPGVALYDGKEWKTPEDED